MEPSYGAIAYCKKRILGLITNGPDGGGTWHGVKLANDARPGDPWQSKHPVVVGHIDQFKLPDPMLKDLLDWEQIMVAPRYAGGHTEVMESLFKGARIVASWVDNDYQGSEAFAYLLPDGRYVCLTDSFGSCSGCDSWEDSSDTEARNMCISLANDAHVFDTLDEMLEFIKGDVPNDKAAYWNDQTLEKLLPELECLQQVNRVGGPDIHPDNTPYATAL